ncbi:MAG: hypothetical protein K2M17_00735, partial [Bacilli bacterium]|nr:hypothetical protein [Bacilli bacterium]
KKQYNLFMSKIKMKLLNFVMTYCVNANHLFPQNDEDDEQWTIDLGEKYGKINILLEGWEMASYNGKVNILSIPMKFHTFRDINNKFEMNGYTVNSFNGKLVPHYKVTEWKKCIKDFTNLLDIWGKGLDKVEKINSIEIFQLN